MSNKDLAVEFLNKLDETNSKTASRIKSSQSVVANLTDTEKCLGESIGSTGEIYKVTLGTCSCTDWTHRKDKEIPCKHQIALAVSILHKEGMDDTDPILSRFVTKYKTKPKSTNVDNKPKKNSRLIFMAYAKDDTRFERLIEKAKELGYKDTNSLCFDIINAWLDGIHFDPKTDTDVNVGF